MKKLLFKSLLAASLCLSATAAWAEDAMFTLTSSKSTYVDSTSGNVDTNYSTAETIQACNTQFRDWDAGAATGTVKVNSGGKIAFFQFDITPYLSETRVLTEATFKFTSVSSETGKDVVNVRALGYNSFYNTGDNSLDPSTITYTLFSSKGNVGCNGLVNLTGTVTSAASFQPLNDTKGYTIRASAETSINALTYVKSALTEGKSTVSFAITANSARNLNINNSATLVLKFVDLQEVNYTVNCVCEGETLLTEVKTGLETTTPTFSTDPITIDGKRYIYVSDDRSTVGAIASDGTTVYTINYREAAIWNYTVTNNANDDVITGSGFENSTIELGVSRYVNADGTLWVRESHFNSAWYKTSVVLDQNNKVFNFDYTKTDITGVIFYAEAENISTLTATEVGNISIRCSNGAGAYATKDAVITTLTPGTYQVCGAVYGNAGTTFTFKVGETEVLSIATNGNPTNTEGQEFTITETSDVVLVAGGNAGTSPKVVDYVYVKAISAALAVSDAEWASLAPAYDVVVPEDVEVYYVSSCDVDYTKAQLTKIEAGTAIKANEGILVKADAGTINFPKATTAAEAIEGNLLVGTQEEIDVPATGVTYVLGLKDDDEVGLYRFTGSKLAAGKAYMHVAASGAPRFINFAFDGTTGIDSVAVETETDGVMYNVMGQVVGADYKGLVIKNGKKFYNR